MPDETLKPPAEPSEGAAIPVITSMATPGLEPDLTQFTGKGPNIVLQTAFGLHQQPSIPDTIAGKLTPEHIASAFDQYGKDKERKSGEARLGMWLAFGALISVLVFVMGLCWMFLQYQKPELLEKIIALITGLAGGGITGFGIGRQTAPKKEE